jgi:DNA-binding CsgD family transcriptional regulator
MTAAGTTNLPHTLPRRPSSELTPRELQILDMAASGLDTNAMADSLRISKEYAKVLRMKICHKLGADTMIHALGMAFRRGLIH